MTLWKRIRGWVRCLHPRISPLRQEQLNLQRKIRTEDARLAELEGAFWAGGGVCCPYCGIPGFSKAIDAQNRRRERLQCVTEKLNRPGRLK